MRPAILSEQAMIATASAVDFTPIFRDRDEWPLRTLLAKP